MTEPDLYGRGCETLLASWAAYAQGSTNATVFRLPGVAVAVFPNEPERRVYNNALLDRGLRGSSRDAALDAMEAAYAEAGVARFTAWVHESDHATREEMIRRGYAVDTATRAMGMPLDDIRVRRSGLSLGPADWSDYLRYEGFEPEFLSTADHAAFHVLAAYDGGQIVAAALAYDHDRDCGIYNVGTVERARRRGLGTAVTVAQLYAARDRGCRTASLQSTPMAERLYAGLGFRDLGRFLEYAPASRAQE